MPRVVYFMRRPRVGNYSIEFLFDQVARKLALPYKASQVHSRFLSNGFFRRAYNIVEAAVRASEINHVTGDVHFLTYLLPRDTTVLTIHDCGLLHGPPSLKREVHKWLWFTLPMRRCAVATVVSEASRQDLLDRVQTDEQRIVVVPDFVSDGFEYSPRAFNAQRPIILHVGTKPNKNLERLAEALAGIPCELHVIGDLTASHREMLIRCGIDYRNFVGLSEAALIARYRACDILAFVSTLEGFGMPILEAQRVGRPVVTSNISSMPEVAGDAAVLVDPFDAQAIRSGILRVIREPALRHALITAGRKNADRFSLERTVQGYQRIYEKLAAHQTARSQRLRASAFGALRTRVKGDIRRSTDTAGTPVAE